MGIFKGENISQSSDRANATDGAHQLSLGIRVSTELFYLIIIGVDLMSKGCDVIQDRRESWEQITGYELE
jgi:hypothetical protein